MCNVLQSSFYSQQPYISSSPTRSGLEETKCCSVQLSFVLEREVCFLQNSLYHPFFSVLCLNQLLQCILIIALPKDSILKPSYSSTCFNWVDCELNLSSVASFSPSFHFVKNHENISLPCAVLVRIRWSVCWHGDVMKFGQNCAANWQYEANVYMERPAANRTGQNELHPTDYSVISAIQRPVKYLYGSCTTMQLQNSVRLYRKYVFLVAVETFKDCKSRSESKQLKASDPMYCSLQERLLVIWEAFLLTLLISKIFNSWTLFRAVTNNLSFTIFFFYQILFQFLWSDYLLLLYHQPKSLVNA